jgi:choline dehydrogenase-like flavoprotein
MVRVNLEASRSRHYDICVIGAGAAGCAVADSLALAGRSVLLVERGTEAPAPAPDVSVIDPDIPHDTDGRTMRQGLGGTLQLWGGRCVPLEPSDLTDRPGRMGGWPISWDEYAAWIGSASKFLGVAARYDCPHPPGWPLDPEGVLHLDRVERLAPNDLAPIVRRRLLTDGSGPDLLLGTTCVGLDWAEAGNAARGIRLRNSAGETPVSIATDQVVLACGGLQVARFLLLEARRTPGRLLGEAWLGRGYTGHLTGSVARIRPSHPAAAKAFRYHRIDGMDPERRRLLHLGQEGVDVAFWLRNLPEGDAGHGSGELSAKALFRSPGAGAMPHLRNLAADPVGGLAGIGSALRTRALRTRQAERLAVRPDAAYRLMYHAEHLPDRDSHVRLADEMADDGMPALRVAFCYGAATVGGLVSAHRRTAALLRLDGFAEVEMTEDDDALAEAIRACARDGYHQMGLTRMAHDPTMGVVDPDGRVFGTRNIHVASASAFPTASQANPTLTIVALALRLANRLTRMEARYDGEAEAAQ